MPPSEVPTSSTTKAVLCFCRDSASLIPVPGLAAAASLVIHILDVVESVKSLKKDCTKLADRAVQVVLSIHLQLLDFESPIPEAVFDNVGPLLRVLGDIKELTASLSGDGWMRRLLRKGELLEQLSDVSNRLDSCFQAFQIRSLLRLQDMLSHLNHQQDISMETLLGTLAEYHKAEESSSDRRHSRLSKDIRSIASVVTSSERRLLDVENRSYKLLQDLHSRRDDIHLGAHRGDIEISELLFSQRGGSNKVYRASYKGRNVLVKKYTPHSYSTFESELTVWKAVWDPNLPQFVERSAKSEDHPFIILSGVVSQDVPSFVRASLSRSMVDSFMTALNTMLGIASGLQYLRSECAMSKAQISECINTSNMMLGNDNRVILAQNLLWNPPEVTTQDKSSNDSEIEAYLTDTFYYLTNEIMFGNPTEETRIEQSRDSHLVELVKIAAWSPVTGTSMDSILHKLRFLHAKLEDTRRNNGTLHFPDIREGILAVAGIVHSKAYNPETPWKVSVGDLGYIKGGVFVCLLRETFSSLKLDVVEDETFVIKHDAASPFTTEELPEGFLRHTFISPAYIAGQRRTDQRLADTGTALRHMMNAKSYLVDLAEAHGMRVHDFIAIIGVTTNWRSYTFEHQTNKQEDSISHLYLFEYTDPAGSGSSAHWSLSRYPQEEGLSNPLDEPGLHAKIVLRPQRVEFVQLDMDDG